MPLWGAIVIAALIGLVSGITGVGGGVFLAPILIILHWAFPMRTAALSAPFILTNSAMGQLGALCVGQIPSNATWLYAVAALIGAAIGDRSRCEVAVTERYAICACRDSGRCRGAARIAGELGVIFSRSQSALLLG
jgi:uncharacterized membrane protein YfcA